jgi:NTE family protein
MKRTEKELNFILNFLKKVSLFEKLPLVVLRKIASQVTEKLIRCREILYLKGEVSESIFIIRYGEIRIEKDRESILLATGDVLAENSLMNGTNHSSTASAVIDTLVYQIPGKLFLQLATEEKILSRNIIRLMASRMRKDLEGSEKSKKYSSKRLFCHIPLDTDLNFKKQVDTILKSYEFEIRKLNSMISIAEFKNLNSLRIAEKLAKYRKEKPFVHIYFDSRDETFDYISLLFQCDFIIFHENSSEKESLEKERFFYYWSERIRNFSGRSIRFSSSKNYDYEDKFFIKTFSNTESLARTLISKTRGLALGGGGARALSHVGLLKVLERENISFDYVSGASFGAVIGALYSNGLTASQIEDIVDQFFGGIESAFDPTLPLISFFRGKRMRRMLKNAFGDKRMEELKIPFITSAIDLQTGKEHIFDQGPITEALTSAMSLPGAFPPYMLGEKVLVDGGIVNNVPENLIREKGADLILGVNVSPMQEMIPVKLFDDRTISGKSWIRFIWDQIRYPPILKIMTRTITLEGREITRLKKSMMDLFVHFHMEEFELFDFRNYKSIIQKGEEEAEKNLSEIKKLFKT